MRQNIKGPSSSRGIVLQESNLVVHDGCRQGLSVQLKVVSSVLPQMYVGKFRTSIDSRLCRSCEVLKSHLNQYRHPKLRQGTSRRIQTDEQCSPGRDQTTIDETFRHRESPTDSSAGWRRPDSSERSKRINKKAACPMTGQTAFLLCLIRAYFTRPSRQALIRSS